jgi:hypothetical protein
LRLASAYQQLCKADAGQPPLLTPSAAPPRE